MKKRLIDFGLVTIGAFIAAVAFSLKIILRLVALSD